MPDKPLPNSLADFARRFDALGSEAMTYGLSVAWIIVDSDPLSGSTHDWGRHGCAYAIRGAVDILAEEVRDEFALAEEGDDYEE